MIVADEVRLAIAGAVAAVVIGATATIVLQHRKINRLEAAAVTWQQAQGTNLSTIDHLRDALDKVVKRHRADQEAANAAVAEAVKSEQNAQAELARKTEELTDVYARSASARAWGRTGVDADVARRLPGSAGSH